MVTTPMHQTQASATTPVTYDTAAFAFYDIESLDNAFTMCIYLEKFNTVYVFYLLDDHEALFGPGNPIDFNAAEAHIRKTNPAMPENTQIRFFDLRTYEANATMAMMTGLSNAGSVNDPKDYSVYGAQFRPVCDTDPHYDPFTQHPYLVGYNSHNYDTVILAIYYWTAFAFMEHEAQGNKAPGSMFTPPVAKEIRRHNDQLFTEEFKRRMPNYLYSIGDRTPANIRNNFIASGRHIDAARLNEVQAMVGLKRLKGGMGFQILESDKLAGHNATIHTAEEVFELFAYNVSDVVGLAKVMRHEVYSSSFDLKKGLIDDYPETIYERDPVNGGPDIRPERVRRYRLTPDSSSAQFAAAILAPYEALEDIPAVSYVYPHPDVAAQMGLEPKNILEETRKFFYENISHPQARAQFDEVYAYYKSIEGKNFNETVSDEVYDLTMIPKRPNNIPYFRADGTPTSAFVTFSTGGIHGSEANVEKYARDIQAWQDHIDQLRWIKQRWPDPLDFRQTKDATFEDGTPIKHSQFLKAGATIKGLTERSEAIANGMSVEEADKQFPKMNYRDEPEQPQLFKKNSDNSTKLQPKYVYTSNALAVHEDFSSYYPNLLRGLNAFYNPQLGEDRYAKFYFDKEELGAQLKDPNLSPEEFKSIKVVREGTKLILNAASGAGDVRYNNTIRMNNTIISMRIIGQLFSWRVGQAQSLAGATIISTNTDGLYSAGLDTETNNRILAEQAKHIGIQIDPEPMHVVSKDANNRMEVKLPKPGKSLLNAKVSGASGGTLACWEEPQPTKSLAHPAALDHGMVQYLKRIADHYIPEHRQHDELGPLTLDEDMDQTTALHIMQDIRHNEDAVWALRMFQHIASASTTSYRFPVLTNYRYTDEFGEPLEEPVLESVTALQQYTRVFIVKDGTPNAASLEQVGAWTVPAPTKLRREKNGEASVVTDHSLLPVLEELGYARTNIDAETKGLLLLPTDRDISLRKAPNIEPHWSVITDNRDLYTLDAAEQQRILDALDLEIYASMLAEKFNRNWKNA